MEAVEKPSAKDGTVVLPPKNAANVLLLMVGASAVGSAGLLARIGLDSGLDALPLAAWRLSLAALLLAAAQGLRNRRTKQAAILPAHKMGMTLAGICLALHFVMWFASLNTLSVARSTLLVVTSPLWAGLLGLCVPILRPGRRFWPGLALAGVGLVFVTTAGAGRTGQTLAGSPTFWQGDALALAGAMLIVPYLLLVQRAQAVVGTLRTVTWTYSAAAVCLLLIALARHALTVPSRPGAWFAIVSMALVPQMIGHTALNRALRAFSMAQVTSAGLLEPIFASLLAWLWLGERVTPTQGLGALLLLGGVALTLQPDNGSDLPPGGA